MDKVHTPAFRTAIGGFNKADVNAYIAKLAHDFDEQNTSLREELAQLKVQLDEAKSQLAENAQLEEAKKAESAASDELKAEIEKANNIIASQTETIEALKNENSLISESLCEAESKLAKYAHTEEKLTKYEEAANRMGEIYMEASVDADRIRSEAKQAADELISHTRVQCDGYVSEVEKTLLAFSESQRSAVCELFEQTRNSITAILADFDKRSRMLAEEARAVSISAFAPKQDGTDE